jgi:hypothetical protein
MPAVALDETIERRTSAGLRAMLPVTQRGRQSPRRVS